MWNTIIHMENSLQTLSWANSSLSSASLQGSPACIMSNGKGRSHKYQFGLHCNLLARIAFCGCHPLRVSLLLCRTPAHCSVAQICLGHSCWEWQAFTEGWLGPEGDTTAQDRGQLKTKYQTSQSQVFLKPSLSLGIPWWPSSPGHSLLLCN